MDCEKPGLLILTGPTAAGKTELSIALARELKGEIISADSMQVYRRMDIGTAKISREEMAGVPHHLIDICEPTESYNVVRFATEAKRLIQEITARGHLPMIVGGTGFYIQAVLYDIDFTENDDNVELREELQRFYEEHGASALHERLREVDEVAANEIHENNVKRTIRALEFYYLTGSQISTHNEEQRGREAAYNSAYFCLTRNREQLYRRIDKRVDEMISKGLVSEVEALKREGCTEEMVSMQGLGYKEILAYLAGRISLPEAIDTLKRETRHFAKRQLTWFRRERDVCMLDKESMSEETIFDRIITTLKERGIIK